MKDGERIGVASTDPFQRLLVQSARRDMPSEQGHQRLLAALAASTVVTSGGAAAGAVAAGQGAAAVSVAGAGGSGAGLAVSTAGTKSLGLIGSTTIGVGKWFAAGVLCGGMVVGAAQAIRPAGMPQFGQGVQSSVSSVVGSVAQTVAGTGVIEDNPPVPDSLSDEVRIVAPSSTPTAATVVLVEEGRVAPASSAEQASVPPASADASAMAQQLALLEGARSALRAGDKLGALELVHQYRARFASRWFDPEAQWIEQQARLGNRF